MWSLSPSQNKQATFATAAALVLVIGAALFLSQHNSSSSHRHKTRRLSGSSSNNHRLLSYFDPKTVSRRQEIPLNQDYPVGNLERDVMMCAPVNEAQSLSLQAEIAAYEKSRKFSKKIREVEENKATNLHKSIDSYLQTKVLQPGWSVLELGCAAGMMLSMVQQHYQRAGQPYKEMVGIELVTGWVRFAEKFFADKGINVFEGDITMFSLPEHRTFDFVMLNDVMEHVQKDRYGCLFQMLREHTHEGSVVYMHTPNPTMQLVDNGQYYENVLPAHFVVAGMALAHFELVAFEPDTDAWCREGVKAGIYPAMLDKTMCIVNNYPGFSHLVFRRVETDPVFNLA